MLADGIATAASDAPSAFDALPRSAANYVPLSPTAFLARSAEVYPDKVAIIAGARRFTYAEFAARSHHLALALAGVGVGQGDVVAALLPNCPELLELHFGAPQAGAVLCALNTRLDAATVEFILRHSEARVLVADSEFASLVAAVLPRLAAPPLLIGVHDAATTASLPIGAVDYEAFIAGGDPTGPLPELRDEWDAIALNYTSGTTGDPKGVVLHHRGAYLNACGNVMSLGLDRQSVYLWTLPMFHCNGWTHTWAVTLAGGVHVCQRRVEPEAIFDAIAEHGVTHLCGAPVVLGMLINAPDAVKRKPAHPVRVATGGAAPPAPVLARMEAMGFAVTHLYGMTECYGPATLCVSQPEIEEAELSVRAAFTARQGVGHATVGAVDVLDPQSGAPVPRDGHTLGELTVRGNTVMKGYFKNPKATAATLHDGWLWTGDLAVIHPDSYIEIKDRSKDIIISGGENISSLEVEEALYRHPAVLEAAVVARPDEKWGETPHAFVALRDDAALSEADIVSWCRQHLAHFKTPKHVTFGPLPKTATGKIQKNVLRQQAALATQPGETLSPAAPPQGWSKAQS
jgi:fatty-acyl-CoA synthase